MSGRRHKMDSTGSTYENTVQLLVGRIASLVKVPREQDYGIDFFCQPRVSTGATTETVTELGSLQVKGGQAELAYGGLNDRGEWRDYELAWLRSLATPLYLAHVDADLTAVELFSLWPLWWIFWRTRSPFEVVFNTEAAGTVSAMWPQPETSPTVDAHERGDGNRWTINLGPPFLRLTNDLLNDATFRDRAVATLRGWIANDRLTLILHQLFIPVVNGVTRWTTNSPEGGERRTFHFWNDQPGVNLEGLSQTASPILVNLGIHLQWQNDAAAYNLVPVLEWLEGRGWLDEIGKGLLDGLRRTQARGVGPKECTVD